MAKAPFATAGGLDDTALYSWRKPDGSMILIKAMAASEGNISITSHNFTNDDLKDLPPLEDFTFSDTKVFSAGNLPMELDPIITNSFSDIGNIGGSSTLWSSAARFPCKGC